MIVHRLGHTWTESLPCYRHSHPCLYEAFQSNVMNSFEPDLSVALGASISSASTLGINTLATITDVVPMSIGVISIPSSSTSLLSFAV